MCSSFRHQIFEKTSVENPESRIQVYFYQMSKLIWKRLQDVIQWFGYLYELGLVNLLNISELRLWICQKNEKSVNNFSKPPSIITLLPKPKTICDYTTLIDELIKIPKLRDHGKLWSTKKKLKKNLEKKNYYKMGGQLLVRPAAAEVRAMLHKIKKDNMERGRKISATTGLMMNPACHPPSPILCSNSGQTSYNFRPQ